ncbi:MAG: hypothetical protein LBQ33_03305 [Oscillospiraceae bacterium]|jgi:hypothetical protein|nr:hypothetical protein [Oscillospiraceae bacterium]
MKILYLISKILSCPGAFLKGFWEHLTCRILRLEVLRRGYFRDNRYCGHVEHAQAQTAPRAFLMAYLPYCAQCIIGFIFFFAGFAPVLLFGLRSAQASTYFWHEVIFLYLGLSCLCNCAPERQDAKTLWRMFYCPVEQAAEEDLEALAQSEEIAAESPAEEEFLEEAIETAAALQAADAPVVRSGVPLLLKILFAPVNASLYAGAWLEAHAVSVLLFFGGAIALFFLR